MPWTHLCVDHVSKFGGTKLIYRIPGPFKVRDFFENLMKCWALSPQNTHQNMVHPQIP